MKILHITYEPPAFPGGTGGQTRQYELLKYLSINHEIHGILPWKRRDEQSVIKEEIFSKIRMPPKKTYFLKFICLIMRYRYLENPRFVRRFECMNYLMMPFIKHDIEYEKYDIINIEHTNIAHWLSSLKLSMPTVIVAHNVKTIMWKRYYENETSRRRNKLFAEYKKFKKYEEKFLKYFDCIIAMSEIDRQYLLDICPGAKRIELVPNGVDLKYFSPNRERSKTPMSLLFTGSMKHPPNEEAMEFFCQDVFPKVLSVFPGATLTIVGGGPSTHIKEFGKRNNINVTGFVPDSRPFFDKAEVFIVPILSGSGTRLKILEAMSMGKAIVSTSIGAEGIECFHDQNIVISDGAEQFANSIVSLLQDENRRKRLGEAARKLVFDKYSWDDLANRTEEIYTDVIKHKNKLF